jgi:hypothetical protein
MRSCRAGRRLFRPLKSYDYWCSWACRQSHIDISDGAPGDIWQARYDASNRHGVHDGQAHARQHATMSLPVWWRLIRIAHPDMHQGSPLESIAIGHRPKERQHG